MYNLDGRKCQTHSGLLMFAVRKLHQALRCCKHHKNFDQLEQLDDLGPRFRLPVAIQFLVNC